MIGGIMRKNEEKKKRKIRGGGGENEEEDNKKKNDILCKLKELTYNLTERIYQLNGLYSKIWSDNYSNKYIMKNDDVFFLRKTIDGLENLRGEMNNEIDIMDVILKKEFGNKEEEIDDLKYKNLVLRSRLDEYEKEDM